MAKSSGDILEKFSGSEWIKFYFEAGNATRWERQSDGDLDGDPYNGFEDAIDVKDAIDVQDGIDVKNTIDAKDGIDVENAIDVLTLEMCVDCEDVVDVEYIFQNLFVLNRI